MTETTLSNIIIISNSREFAALIGLKIGKRGFDVSIETDLETGLERFETETFSSLVFDLDLFCDQTIQQLLLFRDLHSLVPVVFLAGQGQNPDLHALKGPFAIVQKSDVFGVFLDKLLDILRFFSHRPPDRHFRPAAPASPTQFALLDQRLTGMLQAVHDLSPEESDERVYALILKELSNITGARGGSLFSFEKATLVLKHSLDPGHVPETINLPLKPRSPFDQAITQAQPLLIKDIRGTRGLAHSGWQGYNDGSLMVIPLMDARLNIISLISLHNKVEPPFDERDLELSRLFASISSQLLFAEKDAGKSIQKHYREMVSRAPIGLVLFDDTGRILEVNQALCDMIGAPFSEWGHDNYWTLTQEKFRGPEQVLLQELSTLNRPSVFEKQIVCCDSKLIRVRLRYSLFKDFAHNLYLASIEQI